MAEVSFKDVSKVYPARGGGVTAVRNLTLDIPGGAFAVLVGPSGCGKSTTLRMIAGLEEPTSGTISIGGRVVNGVHPKDRDIAMVFQNYALYPHMTVYKNMAFALKLRRIPNAEIDRRVRAAAAMLGIEDLLDRKPRQLSGGQKQRVALGRAIVREPKAFLFDEPLSNLDAKLRVTTRAELKALHARLRTTTVYVTHDQEEAMTLGDLVVVMESGVVHQVGPPLEVYRAPANRFVASFVGAPPMNMLTGRLERDGERTVFIEGGAAAAAADGQRPNIVPVPAPLAAGLSQWIGREVTLGVRPQAFRLSPNTDADAVPFAVTVNVVEPLGEQADAACSTPAHPHLIARLPADAPLRPGDRTTLGLDTRRIHLFEPGPFGRNLAM
jgi:multiple sugar transport system ATP-binding protein